ncbi:hypothetical protein L861_14055 [Litchfieldella anticariensis FP35 = DSM 16096]|uniref:Abasic site processing protein n=1 Tax=Litchfieldella anticariensis (strain DSM 16096 / CECT 5854 / CIP 108499 / LMG 22089 / FP35) TaxID=1121939 RepID=S2KJ90_LITA3|nr:SOS response-associated peptidase [Halomonas anticariensis]EPC00393.1 hypothetical protein L861_14055 [Halomonas anticariensis FP35 = DSM 16096]
MCGRFALYSPPIRLSESLHLPFDYPVSELAPRYNVHPGTWIAAILRASPDQLPVLDEMWWGYQPKWAKGNAPQSKLATAEKVATLGYFKGAFSHHRCLLPADGWFEWLKTTTPRTPHFLCRLDREPMAFAGIYAEREDGALGCAIITEPARGCAQQIHDRMPLILDNDSLEPWLDPDLTDRETIRHLIRHLTRIGQNAGGGCLPVMCLLCFVISGFAASLKTRRSACVLAKSTVMQSVQWLMDTQT